MVWGAAWGGAVLEEAAAAIAVAAQGRELERDEHETDVRHMSARILTEPTSSHQRGQHLRQHRGDCSLRERLRGKKRQREEESERKRES